MKKHLLAIPLLALTACGGPTVSYFYKPEVSYSQFSDDSNACHKSATGTSVNPSTSATAANNLAGAAVSGFISGIQHGKTIRINVESCMYSKGYSKGEIPKEDARALRKLEEKEYEMAMEEIVSGRSGYSKQ